MFALVCVMTAFIVLMPLFHAWRLWRMREWSLLAWGLVAGDAVAFCTFLLLVGRWDIAGYYTRLALMTLLLLTLAVSGILHRNLPFFPGGPSIWKTHWHAMLTFAAFAGAAGYVAFGWIPPMGTRQLALPLEQGWSMVGQGGGNALLNYHASHPQQRYAVDITGLDPWGFRASGLLPADPAAYAVFDRQVTSPCAGEIVEVQDGLADLTPPMRDREHAAGNHIVIACEGMRVELAHLRQASVAVAKGDRVAEGQRLGVAGNSGNSTEPHLHIHATDSATGEAVPISFDGVFPVRGRTFRRP